MSMMDSVDVVVSVWTCVVLWFGVQSRSPRCWTAHDTDFSTRVRDRNRTRPVAKRCRCNISEQTRATIWPLHSFFWLYMPNFHGLPTRLVQARLRRCYPEAPSTATANLLDALAKLAAPRKPGSRTHVLHTPPPLFILLPVSLFLFHPSIILNRPRQIS